MDSFNHYTILLVYVIDLFLNLYYLLNGIFCLINKWLVTRSCNKVNIINNTCIQAWRYYNYVIRLIRGIYVTVTLFICSNIYVYLLLILFTQLKNIDPIYVKFHNVAVFARQVKYVNQFDGILIFKIWNLFTHGIVQNSKCKD